MKKLISILLLSVVVMASLTGCGKDKEPEPIEPVVEEYVAPPTEAKIGDILLLKDSMIPYVVIGKNFTDETTKFQAEYIGVFYPQGVTDSTFYGFSFRDVERIFTESEKKDIMDMALNFDPQPDQVVNVTPVSAEIDPLRKAELARQATEYTVYSKVNTESGVLIGVKDVEFSTDGGKDRFIFELAIDNKSDKEIIANGRLDITLSDGSNKYDCDDGLIDAKDIINFRIPAYSSKTGKIAYEVPAGIGKNLKLIYKSDAVPETVWYLNEKTHVEEKGNE